MVGTEQLGQCERSGKFGKLGWLKTHRAERYPRTGALDVVSHQWRDCQKNYDDYIYRKGIRLVHAGIYQQYDKTKNKRQANPTQLFAGELRIGKHTGVVEIIAGSIYAHHSGKHHNQVYNHRGPVEVAENIRRVISSWQGHRKSKS